MYVSPQGLLVAGDDPQLNPNDKGLIAAVLPHAVGARVVARGFYEPWAFATGQNILTTAAAGLPSPGVGTNAASTQTVRLYPTASGTSTVWEKPVKAVSVLLVFVKYGASGGTTPMFGNTAPNTAPYEAWALDDASGNLTFSYSAGGTYRSVTGGGGSIQVGRVNVALGTYDGATARLFLNGVLLNSASQTGDLVYPTAADRGPGLGNFWNFTSSSRSLVGRIFLGALWETGLPAERAIGITKSPQAAFEAVLGSSRLWLPMPASAGGSTLTATLIEATAGTDLASASAALSASLLDAAAGTDITSAQPTVARSLVDAAGGVDLVNAGAVVNGTLVEGVSAVDLSSALATLSVTVNEAVTVVELLAATRIANVAATEAAAGVDISTTGTSLSGSLVDAVVSADALSAAATLVASVLEAGGVVDQIHAAAQLVVLLTESAAGSDVVSRPAVYSVTATELVAALDVLSAAIGAAGLDPSERYTIAAKARRLTITAAARRLEIRK